MSNPDIRSYIAAPGVEIRDPRSKQRVPHDKPIRVEFSPYWSRREADGSAIRVDGKPVPELAIKPRKSASQET